MSSINTQPIASSGKYVTDSKRAKIRKRSQARENRQPIASARKYVRTRGHEWFGFTFDWSIKQDDSPDWLEVHRKAREVKSRKRLLHLIVFRITCESTLVSRNNFTEDNSTGVKIESELCPQHVTHQFAINNWAFLTWLYDIKRNTEKQLSPNDCHSYLSWNNLKLIVLFLVHVVFPDTV